MTIKSVECNLGVGIGFFNIVFFNLSACIFFYLPINCFSSNFSFPPSFAWKYTQWSVFLYKVLRPHTKMSGRDKSVICKNPSFNKWIKIIEKKRIVNIMTISKTRIYIIKRYALHALCYKQSSHYVSRFQIICVNACNLFLFSCMVFPFKKYFNNTRA